MFGSCLSQRKSRAIPHLVAVLLFLAAAISAAHAALTATAPLCENLSAPLGIDVEKPRLSWRLHATERGEKQTAYEILVATTAERLARDQADLWISGRVNSAETLNIPYNGRPLATSQQVFWKVRVWGADSSAPPSPWSATASFTMGVLDAPRGPGWQPGVQWITDPALLKWERKVSGFSSREAKNENVVKWVQLDLGSSQKIDAVVLRAVAHIFPERYGFPLRFKIEASDDPAFKKPASIQLITDETEKDLNPWISTVTRSAAEKFPVVARYIRVTATKLRIPDEGKPCLAFSQIEILSGPDKKNIARHATVTASDTSEDTAHWTPEAIVDGLGTSSQNPRPNTTLLLRRDLTVRPGLVRALAHITGLGHYVFSANGARIGNGLLTPGWTNYSKTVLYDTYDITAQLRPGDNTLGLVLAGGFYNIQSGPENRYHKLTTPFRPLVAYGQIRLEYDDGIVETINTDRTWQFSPGPTTYANMYGGEDYDARAEPSGWAEPGYDASAWTPTVETTGPGATAKLLGAAHSSPPFAHFETLAPVSIKQIRDGVSVYDFGQNASMMISLAARGPAGSIVRMTPAELVKADGTVDRASSGGGKAYWQYTLRGDPRGETWQPEFFYHGSRYVQVELLPAATVTEKDRAAGTDLPVVEKLESLVTHSDSPPAGDFACSSELLNRIRTLVRWAQRSNLAHVLTDCPHRERLGWLEQYHLNGPALRYEWNLDRIFTKSFDDMAASQTSSGLIPSISPEYVVFSGGFRDSPEWGSAFIIAAWQHYVWTGDDKTLRTRFDAMDDYVEYLSTRAKKHILSHGLGDWYDIGPKGPGIAQLTPIALTATATYYEATRTLARIATAIGREDDAARLTKQADKIADAFNKNFLNQNSSAEKKAPQADPHAAIYAEGSQTAQAMALVLDLVPPERRAAALDALVARINADNYAVTAGDVGYHYLIRALADGGRSDIIDTMVSQSDKPGYSYQLAHGATSLTEAWDTKRTSSQNHFMLGHITEWFYHDLAGLQPDPTGPGFKKIIIKPTVIEYVAWARATHESPRGPVSTSWKISEGKITVEISIPTGSTATVYIPTTRPATVKESGVFAAKSKGVRFLRGGASGREAVFEIDSGNYIFEAEY